MIRLIEYLIIMMKILLTGCAGFIGFHLSKRLLEEGHQIIGIDNMNNYYDINLKESRLRFLEKITLEKKYFFRFYKLDLEDIDKLRQKFIIYEPTIVINLAAQAGVRYSLENPRSYINSNIIGFLNILECCKEFKIKRLIYASSSSVYGGNKKTPFSEKQSVDHPVSLYAVTKKSNELMAHAYAHLYGLNATGLRFFTVYGPWGRPDMALFIFTKSILNNETINIFNHGKMIRDFTYIDDVIESIYLLLKKPIDSNKNFDYLNPDPSSSWAPHKILNIGNSKPTSLMDYVHAIEDSLDIKAKKVFLDMQPGDVEETAADTTEIENLIGFKPNTDIKEGVKNFIKWYKEYYSIK